MLLRILPFLLLPTMLGAQTMTQQWEKTYGGGNGDVFHKVIQATNGYLIAVGETASKSAGGKDGYLIIADYTTGTLLTQKRFGGGNDDVFKSVIQTFDGRFLMAGYTESGGGSGGGKRDGWLVMVDDRGELLWQQTYGAKGDESFEVLALSTEGSFTTAGYKDGGVWITRISEQELKWEKVIGQTEYETIGGMAVAGDGGIVMTGNTKKSAKRPAGDIWLARTSPAGEPQWERFFGEKGWEESLDLISTQDGGYALAGLTRSKGAGDLDIWVIKVSREGFQQWEKTFGGKDADLANSLVQTYDGGLMVVGGTRSHRSGARQYKGYVIKIDAGGFLQWEQSYGGESEDMLTTACLLSDGNTVVGGRTASFGGGGDDAWLFQLNDLDNRANALANSRELVTVKIGQAKLNTTDGILRPNERSFISLQITNPTVGIIKDVRVQVDNAGTAPDVNAWTTNFVGYLQAGEVRQVKIPVQGSAGLSDGQQQLRLTVTSGTRDIETSTITFQSKEPVPASAEITFFQYTPSKTNDEITLSVRVENPGDFPTKSLTVTFECPQGYQPRGPHLASLGALLPRAGKEAKLTFIKTAGAKANAGIVCVIAENGKESVRKTLEMSGGGGVPFASGPLLIWTDPAPHELGTNKLRRSEDFIEFKMTVVSGAPLQPRDFRLRVNGSEMEGSKFNEEELSPPKREKQQYTYTYRNKVPLKRGKNELQIAVGNQLSEPLEVTFEPRRANLHLVTIGPSHPDLKFTGKDAADFAAAFQNQGGADKLFSNVFIRQFNLPEVTTLTGIQQAMYDLVYQYKDQLITPDDVLMVFISSHGKVTGNRFKILQSNYNPKYEQIVVDFKTDIIENLNQIDCKKLVFLDACHSGAARSRSDNGGLSTALIDLAKAQPGIATLTSCRSTELSYEDNSWENGAFTEALLEAFEGKTATDDLGAFTADANGDKILRLGELYDYLQRRVAYLVKSQLPDAPTTQVPFMPDEQLDRNMPIYYLGK